MEPVEPRGFDWLIAICFNPGAGAHVRSRPGRVSRSREVDPTLNQDVLTIAGQPDPESAINGPWRPRLPSQVF